MKIIKQLSIICLVYVLLASCNKENITPFKFTYVFPSTDRSWQGIPTIEVQEGKIYVAWYSGGDGEGPDNYVTVYVSDIQKKNWNKDVIIIDPQDSIRAFDPVLWKDRDGKLWLFWNESFGLWDGVGGVWASSLINSSAEKPIWSQPIRLADGVMINKPIYHKSKLLMPIALWPNGNIYNEKSGVHIYSADLNNFDIELVSSIPLEYELRSYDEHQIVKIHENQLNCYMRTNKGIYVSQSFDDAQSWSKPIPFKEAGDSADSKFHIRELKSGNLLLIKNNSIGREKMTLYISNNKAQSWDWQLELDSRPGVSYPDATEGESGQIYVVYDRDRTTEKEIIIVEANERDVLSKNNSQINFTILK